jgi:hypothetical protein
MTKITTDNYWISPRALSIQLNAMGDADHIQASVAAGAQILCYVKGVEGLEYDAGHNYRHWPLRISPTYFPTETHKYVCVAIPRSEEVGTEAIVSFPDEELDIYGMNEAGEQVGNEDYYYVWLQGIISGHIVESGYTFREWEEPIDTGRLNSDEAYDAGGDGTWWKLLADGTVDFIKTINHAVFNFLEAAQATIHNLNVTGTLDAIKGYIDDLRSHNYQSGLLDGSGFRLTNDNGEGGSELEIDFLKVRKKATFMELEIREETFVGGNNHYSPAGSVIYRVEYMDENDEALGYTVMKVPFLLKRFAFLGRVFNYAARKRIRRQLSDDEWSRVHHFRCYLLADNGTTATRNWWKVGDQPRCQTFNKAISSQNKRKNTYNWKEDHFNDDPATPMPDYTTIEGPFETAYYWRLVTNVGSEKLEDGHAYDFVDLPYEGWNYTDSQGRRHAYTDNEKRSFRDGGSGIPVAGDTIVCIGNRTDESRMNVVSLYTSGSDNHPPAIKGYRGIHTFSFENCLVWEMSPEQFLVRSKAFKLLDDSGYEFPVPLERSEWTPNTRYHWYDRVSWKGSIWLCQVLDNYIWETANGTEYQQWQVEDIEYGEGNFTYSVHTADDEVVTGTDHYYATGKVGGQTVYKIRLYTYSEPSKDNDLWLREVSKGTEIVDSKIHYAASLDGLNHPADDSADWKATIAATGVSMGKYLWTRTTIYYDDPNDPDREPTREYSVSRWGIDGDGIEEIDSYYLATSNTELVVNASTDTYPKPGDSGWDRAGTQAKWYNTFGEAATANGGVGQMQGWNVWEKTVVKYEAWNDDGTPKIVPDLVNYRCSRIGQDGQIGQEEYYCLRSSADFATAFGGTTYDQCGIRWYNASDPAAENWRLAAATASKPNINTTLWKTSRPAFQEGSADRYLWNFEQRVDGMGTEYATKPVCIGDASRGIAGVIELYALSSSQTPVSSSILVPSDINDKNTYGVIPTSGFDDVQVWGDEKYERAPSEALPYQWNWTRTLYSTPKDDADTERYRYNGKDYPYEDHYHVSAVRGTKGEDGAGVEYVYKLTSTEDNPGSPANPQDRTVDDYVPSGWTDNPSGVSLANPFEWVSERKSSATTGAGSFTGGHTWGDFSAPRIWSKWGKNGQDGDGMEYVYIRTKTSVAPAIVASADSRTDSRGRTYLDDEYLPLASGGSLSGNVECTDDPAGVSREYPYEWVSKRTKAAPATTGASQGQRQWEKYSGKMALWSHYGDSNIRLDLSNEMDMVQTDANGLVTEERIITTIARLFDGTTEITLKDNKLWTDGGLTPYPKEQEGKGLKLTFKITKNFSMKNALEVKVNYRYPDPDTGTVYTSVITIAPSKGQPIYQLSPSLSALPCTRKADNTLNDPPALSLKVVKVDGASTEELDAIADKLTDLGVIVRYSTSGMPTSASGGSPWPADNSYQAISSVPSVFIAMFNSSGVLLDRETVPVIKDGENGKNVSKLDISNEMDSVLTSSDGKVTLARTVETVVSLYDGSKEVDISAAAVNPSTGKGISVTGGPVTTGQTPVATFTASASGKGKKLSWGFFAGRTMNDSYEIEISYSYNDVVYKAVFTVTAAKMDALYQLSPSHSALPCKRNDDNTLNNPPVLSLKVVKIDGSSSDSKDATSANLSSLGVTVRYSTSKMPASDSSEKDWSALNPANQLQALVSDDNVYLALFKNGAILDRETIPVVRDGSKGDPGDASTVPGPQGPQGVYEEKQYALSAYKTAQDGAMPADCRESDWVSVAPLPSVYKPFVWQRTHTYNPSTGIYTDWSYVRLTGDTGSQGKTGLWYRYLGVWGVDCGPGSNPYVAIENTTTVGYYVKHGASFWMNVKSSGANTTEPDTQTAAGWEQMTSVFEYFMTKVTFADSAYLGSFIINGDWMISQYGKVNGYDSSSYQRFNPNDMSSASAFIPNFAVDGKTGKVYANDFQTNGVGGAFVKINSGSESQSSSETNVTILDTKGLYSRGSQDGFRIIHGSSGVQLERWHKREGWTPFYAGRAIRKISDSAGNVTLDEYDDYVIAGKGTRDIYLPNNPHNGKVITVKNLDDGIYIKVQGSDRIVVDGDYQSETQVPLDDYDRAELVYYDYKWYWSYMGT